MIRKIVSTILVVISLSTNAQSSISTSQALNLVSKQSTLCERLTKEKILTATSSEDKKTDLNLHIIQFEKNNSILKQSNLPKEIESQLTNIEMLWYGFKQKLQEKNVASIDKTLEFNNTISKQCEGVFNSLLAYAKEENKYPYNSSVENLADVYQSANTVKFLSQKLASHYMAYYSREVIYDAELFDNILEGIDVKVNELTLGQDSSPVVLAKTNTLLADWNALIGDVKPATESNFVNTPSYPNPDVISKRCDALMKNADSLIRLYKQTSDTN